MISTYLNNIFAEIYNTIITRIYTLVYSIKLSKKLIKAFCSRQTWICGNNVGEAKCRSFSQIKILPFRAFKEKLHIGMKLLKRRSITAIGIKIHLSLTG